MLKASGVREAELSIIFLDGKAMRGLNRKSLGHDYVTDVITFDYTGVRGQGSGVRVQGRNTEVF